MVDSSLSAYKSTGTFSCANDGTLFYSNGTQLNSTQTTCLATAEWSGQDGLQCWKGISQNHIFAVAHLRKLEKVVSARKKLLVPKTKTIQLRSALEETWAG